MMFDKIETTSMVLSLNPEHVRFDEEIKNKTAQIPKSDEIRRRVNDVALLVFYDLNKCIIVLE
jgi:hypothetical protein